MRDECESDQRFRVLLVEDEPVAARLLQAQLASVGGRVTTAGGVQEALRLLSYERFDLALVDLGLPDGSGLSVVGGAVAAGVPAIVQTASDRVEDAVEAMRAGACDFIVKPVTPSRLVRAVTAARGATPPGVARPGSPEPHTPMGRTLRLAEKVARSAAPILVRGETGSGKEWLARRIVELGPRADRPFLAVNCAALPADLAESLLFGHERGAFSGATERHPGRFAEADGGTLLLDEVGDLAPALQAKLLRVLEDGEIDPVGARRPRRVDVRVIAATHRDLAAMVRAGSFREDLYWRLAVFEIEVPPLRERRDEIPELIRRFVAEAAETGRAFRADPDAVRQLSQRDWPGNIRELRHAVLRAVVLADTPVLGLAAFDWPPASADDGVADPDPGHATEPFSESPASLSSLAEVERETIVKALQFHGGSMTAAARSLRIGRSTLYRKMELYGLSGRGA
ncbi:sigma-54-dependent transcriptional regulator [Aureimonas jatrophae]|uniref:DNA-binding transcriptional response regulator, NtrC family, contains REC, AAA-type ATPase, and a Fis-type DNA-binding domains n=1 Tax=Aureimonas jatrophae TaxID=1166073 RepID=A0A1H0IGT3_9HYPH|nr:sigma-54 dependent transcriptional regulator [Aureimonas jatrophae]MBB3952163.1 DNA-binding NtrC family response regulator [Aureimonas jatrophae]SDO30657.1 DNA-binding transcriptional response regulator, NtrC family, contains REC, AAA-type ATPase, and a Fis-type DNA-binding domains [Aureimonas jatrophae]